MDTKRKLVGGCWLIDSYLTPASRNIERILMETKTEMLAKQLVRHFAESKIKGSRGQEERDEVLQEAFHNAMRSRVRKLIVKKRKDVEEDFSSFLGAVGKSVGGAVAHQVATGLGISSKTVTGLASALLKPSKKTTTKMLPSKQPTAKKPTAKKKKIKSKSAAGNPPQKPKIKSKSASGNPPQKAVRMSADQYRKEAGLAPRASKNEEILTVAEIRKFKQGEVKCEK
jgi:hypothetical protein